MIAKRISIRNPRKSSFSGLVKYITKGAGEGERVGSIRITHCNGEHHHWAALEAEHVQAMNTRAVSDKTYHLIVSFREQDNPSPEVLRAIEDQICAMLGYSEHQRVSAVHQDTDHLHMHLAINKVHPKHYRLHEPYYDKRELGKLCLTLEAKYGLAADNHTTKRSLGESKARDMEHAAGFESLIGWVQRQCLQELLCATSWEQLHQALAKNGLTLQLRGNGLVVLGDNGIAAKASSISRDLSKPSLEKKWGAFVPPLHTPLAADRKYQPVPVLSKMDTSRLWTLYQAEKVRKKHWQQDQYAMEKIRKNRRIEGLKKSARVKRSLIKLAKGKTAKRMLRHTVSAKLAEDIRDINLAYRNDRLSMYQKAQQPAWFDWLKLKAKEGDAEALAILRSRYERQHANSNSLGAADTKAMHAPYQAGTNIRSVTKMGTIIYRVAQTAIRDDGTMLRLTEGVSHAGIEAALKLAVGRFGTELSVQGTESFRQSAVSVAATAGIELTFSDVAMENRRRLLLSAATSRRDTLKSDAAASAYIEERNDSRKKTFDILEHRRYSASDAGSLSYAGVRSVNGVTLMLMQHDRQMLVLPIDEKTAYRVRQMSIGNRLEIMATGVIRTRAQRL